MQKFTGMISGECMMQSSEKRVLVVEDEPLLMMMAGDIVEGVGLEAIEATNARDAITMLEARTDIAVVLDIEMPGTNGLAASVRKRWPLIGNIVVSGRVTIDVADLRKTASLSETLQCGRS